MSVHPPILTGDLDFDNILEPNTDISVSCPCLSDDFSWCEENVSYLHRSLCFSGVLPDLDFIAPALNQRNNIRTTCTCRGQWSSRSIQARRNITDLTLRSLSHVFRGSMENAIMAFLLTHSSS